MTRFDEQTTASSSRADTQLKTCAVSFACWKFHPVVLLHVVGLTSRAPSCWAHNFTCECGVAKLGCLPPGLSESRRIAARIAAFWRLAIRAIRDSNNPGYRLRPDVGGDRLLPDVGGAEILLILARLSTSLGPGLKSKSAVKGAEKPPRAIATPCQGIRARPDESSEGRRGAPVK